MQTVPMKLLTVIAERLLENRILEELLALGATGYSVGEVHGRGSRGVHASEWEGPNVRVEAIVSSEVAEKALRHLAGHYFSTYAVIAFSADIQVVRGDKYSDDGLLSKE